MVTQIAGGVTAVTGFIAGLVGFAQLVQGEAGLVTLLLLGLGIGLVWLACLYFARFWQPEKQDKVPSGIQPPTHGSTGTGPSSQGSTAEGSAMVS